MSKRNIKNIILLLILLIYSFVNKIYICKNLTEYTESITACFALLFTCLSIKLLGFQKSGNSKIKQTITKGILIFVIIYFILLSILGIYNGYISNSYSFEFILFYLITVMSMEIFRYVIIRANNDKKYIAVITTLIITIFELLYFKGSNLFETVSRNILISYLVYNIGFIPGIVFRIFIDIFKLAIPVPDISNYLSSILYIGITIISYLYASRKINKYNISKNKDTNIKLFDITFISFIIVLICMISHLFPYCIMGNGSGSMEPELKLGDAVVVNQISKNEQISEGKIIVYNVKDIQVIHRVVEIKKVNGKTFYKTKGDANDSIDDIDITMDDIYGVVDFKIPLIATPTIYLSKFLNGD